MGPRRVGAGISGAEQSPSRQQGVNTFVPRQAAKEYDMARLSGRKLCPRGGRLIFGSITPKTVQQRRERDPARRQALRQQAVAVTAAVHQDAAAGGENQPVPEADQPGEAHASVRVEIVQRVDDRRAAAAQRVDQGDSRRERR